MAWKGDVRSMVVDDMREAARLRGAMSPEEEPGLKLAPRVEKQEPAGRRRIVRRGDR